MIGRGRALGIALATATAAGLVTGSATAVSLDSSGARDLALVDRAPSFALNIDDREAVGDRIATFVMPGDVITLTARGDDDASLVLRTGGQGVIERQARRQWHWRAPNAPGRYELVVHNRDRSTRVVLQVFVKQPYDNDNAVIDGYRIGQYQARPLRRDMSTAPPPGLVRVTRKNRDTLISPHFRLGDFLCHQQPSHWPKYVLVRTRLLDKLEHLRAALGDAGFEDARITVMSGYRTPWYNADIGNTTVYSRHLFGGAADIFVDNDGDGTMDDLNQDGRIDIADARWLADIIETVTAEHPELVGGLSTYSTNAYHGPFVHTDARGVPARW